MIKLELNKKTATILFYFLIVLVFIFIIFTSYYMVKNKEVFIENPFVYGVKSMEFEHCNCDCYNEDDATPISLYVNKTSLSPIELEGGYKVNGNTEGYGFKGFEGS